MREIIAGRPYKHFKGKLYYVHAILENSENGEWYVSYQGLYAPYKMYVKPLALFSAEVEKNRMDNITNQIYKFELFQG